jgi:3-oxoacyl-[acyl-carrier protein] reductase
VNNAGVYQFQPFETVSEKDFRRQFDTNVLGPILTTQEALKLFGSEGGSIINISSVVSSNPIPAAAVYSATKSALDSITRSLSEELGPRKIRVNAINPGLTETEGLRSTAGFVGSDAQKQILGETPLGRIGQPEDIATAVLFLASEDARWITGESIRVSGGLK